MAAVVEVRRYTGADNAPELNNVLATGTQLAVADTHLAVGSAVDPVPVPTSGISYSFWCSQRLWVVVPPAGSLSNVRVWFLDRDRTLDAPGIIWLGQKANVAPNAGYRQARGDIGVSGLPLSLANHPGLTAEVVDPLTWVSTAPLSLGGTISTPSTGPVGDFVVLQRGLTSAYPVTGELPAEAMQWAWDES
jgi:hypothetical protein